MVGKQKAYLAGLLADDESPEPASADPLPSPPPRSAPERARGTTLLGRESALARIATGEVKQVTQLMLDPARVRVWGGNARVYSGLSEENCRELIDSIIAEGGQKVPAVVRRIDGDPEYEFEVVAGTRRHFSVSWLRAHSYPEMTFLAQVAALDDEAAFRLADLENRARADISDIERAKNYSLALHDHYGGHLTRMAERLRVSKGWLSKMIRVASLPDNVIAAFASPSDIQLKPAYALAQAMGEKGAARAITAKATEIAKKQASAKLAGAATISAAEVMKQLLAAPTSDTATDKEQFAYSSRRLGRLALSVQSANRQGVTIRLHAGSGADEDELADALREALQHLQASGRGLQT